MKKKNLALMAILGLAACVGEPERARIDRASQASTLEPHSDSDRERPVTLEPSPLATVLGPTLRRVGLEGSPVNGPGVLQQATPDELRSYFALLRDVAHARGDEIALETREAGDRAPTAAQRGALTTLQRDSAGRLRVVWNPTRGAPASVESLAFFRGRRAPQEVWTAFLEEHLRELTELWGVAGPEQLALTEANSLGVQDGVVVLRGARSLLGVPVLGQSFEAHVTTGSSPLGAGVLTRLVANFDRQPPQLPDQPRASWLSREVAIGAVASAEPAAGANLVLACGERCTPYWRVGFQGGRVVTVNALSGALEGDENRTAFVGPVQLHTWPPGATSSQAVAFRNANVVNGSGASLGNTAFTDGTHSFTGSTAVSIGLEGAVGASNLDARRRVFRQEFVGGTWVTVPLRRTWTPSSQPTRNFGSPDAWAPNSDLTVSFPHATEVLYGLTSYWTHLFDDLKVETTGRMAIILSSMSSGGIACGSANTGDFGSPTPDPDGNITWSAINCGVDSTDDVDSVNHVNNGDLLFSAGHEFGHTIEHCASVPGTGCARVYAQNIPTFSRPASASQWKFAVSDGEAEVVPTFIGNVLSRYLYVSYREGVPFDPNWNYTSYTSTTDSFGSPGQGGPTGDCLAGTTCPTGYACVPTQASYYSIPGSYTAGLCTKDCTSTGLCDPGTACTAALATTTIPSGRSVCWHSQYGNKFWDSMGDRLVFTVGWRDAMLSTLSAVSGQSANAARDIVAGTDNYYDRYLQNGATRFEVTRAFQAVYSGTGLAIADDFPDHTVRGTPISLRSTSWTPIWWGHGLYDYPKFEDYSDSEVVLFRGVAGASYDIEAWLMDIAGAPIISVTRLNDPSSTSSSSWYSTSGSLTTPTLAATDWYAVTFWGAVGAERWRGRMRVASSSDDLSGTLSEGLPVVHGISATGSISSSIDADAFQTYVPISGTSLTITATGLSSFTLTVYKPDGSPYTSATLTSSSPSLAISSVPVAGHWFWTLSSSSTGSYSTTAHIGCASSSPACDTALPTRTTRYAWGDRFAGRLPNGTTEHVYQIALQEYQGVSVSLADNVGSCAAEVRVFPPTGQRHFDGHPVLRWTDGAAATDLTSTSKGIGGYFEALTTGTYEVRVRSPSAACSYYRLQLATTNVRGISLPAW